MEKYVEPCKAQWGWKELEGSSVSTTGPALSRWGNWKPRVQSPLSRCHCLNGEIFKAESERTGLWQPKWNENLSSPCHSPYLTGMQVTWKVQWLRLEFRDCGSDPRAEGAAVDHGEMD